MKEKRKRQTKSKIVDQSLQEKFDKVFISQTSLKRKFDEAEKYLNEQGGVVLTSRGRINSLNLDLACLIERKGKAKIIEIIPYTDINPDDKKRVTRLDVVMLKTVVKKQ